MREKKRSCRLNKVTLALSQCDWKCSLWTN